MKKNGVEIGRQYLQQLEAYLSTTSELPSLANGSLNLSAIANGANLPRQSLYKNPSIRKRLETVKNSASNLSSKKTISNVDHYLESQVKILSKSTTIEDYENLSERQTLNLNSTNEKAKKNADRAIHQLEQKNAALFSEIMELRRQLKELKMQVSCADLMIESGRRVYSPVK